MVNRPRVLVASPDPGICQLLQRHFGNAGYGIITANRGPSLLDQLRRVEAVHTVQLLRLPA